MRGPEEEERGQEENGDRSPLRDGQGWPPPELTEMHGGGGEAALTRNHDSRRPGRGRIRHSLFVQNFTYIHVGPRSSASGDH